MGSTSNLKYFVRSLTDEDYHPVPEAQFLIQVLNEYGEEEICVYFSYATTGAMAVHDPMRGFLTAQDNPIPSHIVEKCRNRNNWPGYDMDEDGEACLPGFYPPDEAALEKLRERVRRNTVSDG